MALAETLEDIELAFRQLEFLIRLLSWVERGKIDPKEFDDEHIVKLEEAELRFPAGHFGDANNIHRCAIINVLLAMGATAIALDRGFEEKKIERKPKATDFESELRSLVYMVRCCYAHDIASPKWEVRGAYERELTLNEKGISLKLDLKSLNGQEFHVDQIGGYPGWYTIHKVALALLKVRKN